MLRRLASGLGWGAKRRPGRRAGKAFLSGVEWLDRREVPAVVLPVGFSESGLVDGLNGVASAAVAPDGRIFLSRYDGIIQIVKNGQLLDTPFYKLDTTNWSRSNGLFMSVELDPNFEQNQFVYLFYRDVDVAGGPSINRLARIKANGDVADPASFAPIFEYMPLKIPDGSVAHNGGNFVFGKDGKIYIPTGDLLASDKVQSLEHLNGKVLRINPDGSIPEDNPFYSRTTGINRSIYALGFRNPFTIASDPVTGKIFVNDVGDQRFEEVNDLKPGANYGWPNAEGPSDNPGFTSPFYAYTHNDPDTKPGGTAVIGGAFYHTAGAGFSDEYQGLYFFGDYNNGWVKTLNPTTGELRSFATGLPDGVTDFDVTPDGRLIYVSLGTREVRQIRQVFQVTPEIDPLASEVALLGEFGIFRSNVTGLGPYTYQWQLNGADLPGETGPNLAVPADLALNGAKIRVIVTNAYGVDVSNEAIFNVKNDHAPTARIVLPRRVRLGRLRQGQVLNVSATGFDREDRRLKPSQFSWSLDLLHNDHVHPGAFKSSGKRSIRLRLPQHAENGNIAYRVSLTVTDRGGNPTTVTQTINLAG